MEEANSMTCSEPNIFDKNEQHTPQSYVFQRSKRCREDDLDSELSAFKEEMRAMILDLKASQRDEMKNMYSTLMEIKATNTNIESSMTFLANQNEELKNKLEQLETQNRKDRDYIILLEEKVENLQREARKSNIEIKNVPRIEKESKEDLVDMTLRLATTIGCNLKKNDIKDIYRLQNKRNNIHNYPIIIEFMSTMIKTDFMKLVKEFNIHHKEKLCAKHLGHKKEENTPIFVSEQLTARGARLHYLARDLSKSKAYKYCWTAYGKIYVRKDDNSKIINIKSEEEVNYLMQQK